MGGMMMDQGGGTPPDDQESEPAPDQEAPEGEGQGQDQGGDQGGGVTPAEQKLYEKLVLNCFNILYDEKVTPQVITKLRAADHDPIGVLADIAVMIITRVANSAGGQIDNAMLEHAGTEVIEEIAELSDRVKAHHFTDEEKQGALYRGIDKYVAQLKQSGQVDQNDAKQKFQAIVQADKSGALDKAVPGLRQHFAKALEKGKQAAQQQQQQGDQGGAPPAAPAAPPGRGGMNTPMMGGA